MQFLDPSGLECKRVQILVLVNLLDSKTEKPKVRRTTAVNGLEQARPRPRARYMTSRLRGLTALAVSRLLRGLAASATWRDHAPRALLATRGRPRIPRGSFSEPFWLMLGCFCRSRSGLQPGVGFASHAVLRHR